MSASFDFETPDHFTAGAVGPPGQRVFYLQARQADTLYSLKCEKEQVGALAEYLGRLLASLPPGDQGQAPDDLALVEPVDSLWAVAALGAGYDGQRERVIIEARELIEDGGEEDEAAVGRIALSRAHAAAFVEHAQALVQAGRPLCPACHQPKDPEGHVCPRSNGHVVRRRDA
jgi:uncharacterized repeat protein (TIGR03847 family)